MDIMKRHKSTNPYNIREEIYAIYRNYLLDKVIEWNSNNNNNNNNRYDVDHLIWIDMDLRGFDVSSIAHEFSVGWRNGYDVLCTNGIKYTGWYYDSYATLFYNNVWAHGMPRWKISNIIRDYRYYDMRSCFGGFASINFKLLLHSNCRYESFGHSYAKLSEFEQFADKEMIHKVCEHLSMNMCLRENGAKIAVSTRAHSFYGNGADKHG